MSNQDWWSRKLGGNTNTIAPRPVVVQPQYPQQQRPMQNPMQAYQQPQPAYDMSGIPLNEGERQERLDPTLDGNATLDMGTALRKWRGGQAFRTEGSSVCPSCGSANVFTRRNGGTITNTDSGRASAPAPRCFQCGWNGMYAQGPQI